MRALRGNEAIEDTRLEEAVGITVAVAAVVAPATEIGWIDMKVVVEAASEMSREEEAGFKGGTEVAPRCPLVQKVKQLPWSQTILDSKLSLICHQTITSTSTM